MGQKIELSLVNPEPLLDADLYALFGGVGAGQKADPETQIGPQLVVRNKSRRRIGCL